MRNREKSTRSTSAKNVCLSELNYSLILVCFCYINDFACGDTGTSLLYW